MGQSKSDRIKFLKWREQDPALINRLPRDPRRKWRKPKLLRVGAFEKREKIAAAASLSSRQEK